MYRLFSILLATIVCGSKWPPSGPCPKFKKTTTLKGTMPIVAYHNEMNDKHDHVYCDKTSVYPPPPVVQVPGTNYSMSRFIVDSDNAKFVILWSCMDFKTQHTGTVETFAKSKLTAAEIEKVKAIHKQNGFKHTVFFCP